MAGLRPFSEIGKRLGISGETARSVCEQALAKLRKQLEEDPERAEVLRRLLMPDPPYPWGQSFRKPKSIEEE